MAGRGDKRKGDGGGRGDSRKKSKYYQTPKNNGQALPYGSKGILVTCDVGFERKASDEIVGVIEEHYALLSPEEASMDAATPSTAGEDLSALLEKEVAALKDKKQRKFVTHDTGVKGTVYVIFPDKPAGPTPQDVIHAMCNEVKSSQQLRTRHINRLFPITHTCFASLEEMKKIAPDVAAAHFPAGEDAHPIEFALEYDHRSADKLNRLDVIDAFVTSIPCPPHKVNLTKPDQTILVQLLRNSCGVGVTTQFRELCKFNVRVLADPQSAEQASKPKKEGKKPEVKDMVAEEPKEGSKAEEEKAEEAAS